MNPSPARCSCCGGYRSIMYVTKLGLYLTCGPCDRTVWPE